MGVLQVGRSVEVWRLEFKGNFYATNWTEHEIRKGIEYYNRAIALDPNDASAIEHYRRAIRVGACRIGDRMNPAPDELLLLELDSLRATLETLKQLVTEQSRSPYERQSTAAAAREQATQSLLVRPKGIRR
jgi:hypothetical protein